MARLRGDLDKHTSLLRGATTLSTITFSIMGLFATLAQMTFSMNDTQLKTTLSLAVSSIIMLSVAFFIVMLSVNRLSVVMLSVMPPITQSVHYNYVMFYTLEYWAQKCNPM